VDESTWYPEGYEGAQAARPADPAGRTEEGRGRLDCGSETGETSVGQCNADTEETRIATAIEAVRSAFFFPASLDDGIPDADAERIALKIASALLGVEVDRRLLRLWFEGRDDPFLKELE
jgi:hypothetical protein